MPELDAVYEEIYQMNTAADSESRNIAMRAYRWILAAQRQLLIAELTEAVSYDERGVSDLALTPELLLKLCSNFIFADLLQAVQFSHLSAREFLEKRCTHSVLDYSAVQNHKQAAISCLSFLTHNDIQGVKSLEVGTGFLGYAFGFWMVHSQLAQDFREEPPLKKLFQNMISNTPSNGKEPFLGWMNALEECQSALRMDGSFQHPNKLLASQSYPPNPLFLGCVWGFREVFDMVSCSIDLKQLNAQKKTGLYVACEYGNYDVALILLEKGADVNAITGAHGSALQAAASGGYEQIVELLLDRGASLNFRDYNDTSALGAAAKGGYESIFRRLFEMGADQGDYGSALRNAAAGGSRDLIKLLLDAGADVECLGGYGGRPLVEAAYKGRKEAVEILLEYGADVNGAGRPWGTPLQGCSGMGHTNIAELLLLHGARPNDVGGLYGSALHAAAARGHLDLMTVLLRNGADINLQGIRGDGYAVGTPLRVAAEYGVEQSVMFLLQNGADINKPGGADLHISTPLQTSIFTGRHPRLFKLLLEKGALAYPKAGEFNEELCLASESGDLEIVRLLIDKGADVNFIGGRWGTPLQASVIRRPDKERGEIAKLLIQEGAKVNLTDPARPRLSSALESAAVSGYLSLVKLLLKEGACLAQGQSDFGCALTAAAAGGRESIVQFLLDTNAEIDFSSKRYGSALHAAAENGNLKVVKLLLARGADVNQTGGRYHTALQAATIPFFGRGNGGNAFEVFQTLVEHGAEINKVGGKFGSALHSAAFKGFDSAVHVLIEKGANLNAFGGVYGYPLQAAASMEHDNKYFPYHDKEFYNLSTVEKLLDSGADVNALGGRSGSALRAAALVGNEDVVKLLLARGADVNLDFKQRGTALAAAVSLGRSNNDDEYIYRRKDRPESWFRNMVRMLLDSGAVVDGKVMEAATAAGDEKIISMLKEKFDESTVTDDHDDETMLGNLFD